MKHFTFLIVLTLVSAQHAKSMDGDNFPHQKEGEVIVGTLATIFGVGASITIPFLAGAVYRDVRNYENAEKRNLATGWAIENGYGYSVRNDIIPDLKATRTALDTLKKSRRQFFASIFVTASSFYVATQCFKKFNEHLKDKN